MSITAADVKQRALALGFDLCGIAPALDFSELAFLPQWLRRGYGGRMTYLNRTAKRRADVRRWLPSAQSVIVVACVYNTDAPYSIEVIERERAQIARFAWGDDYHDVMGTRVQALTAWVLEAGGADVEARWCVDDGPVQERVYAQYAGLGWIGKNTCVINPQVGSWILLGVIVTSLHLDHDDPALDQCGTCQLCIEACPTGAIVEPRVLDARRCLSYLTIEVRGDIPEDQRADLASHVFGCDICQDVCPCNASAARSAGPEWQPRTALDQPTLTGLSALTDAELESAIAGTALRRAGVAGLRRNLALALANLQR
ncbi:MAG: tRNA epoxyqueuosine(34) reductase QueG [Acidobacteria bacterium]|nr:tRNA epoxyqueuosine(34) reductase QueG [Acidobacteriota bacterium]